MRQMLGHATAVIRTLAVIGCLSLMLAPFEAHAYVGPGLGAGTIAVVFGIVLSVFLALMAVLWYPFKRLLKAKQANRSQRPEDKPAGTLTAEQQSEE